MTVKDTRKICDKIDIYCIFYIDDVYNCIITMKITPVQVILSAKISVALICAWPPSRNATKFNVILFKVLWCISYLNTILLLLPLLNSIYAYRDDPVILGKSVCLSCAVLHIMFKMMVCRIRCNRFQMIYYEMEMFVKQGNEETNITLQHYVDNYKHIYGSYILFCYLGAIGIICGPLFLADEFPAPAKYPFSIEHFLMKSIIYLQQSLVAFQTVAAISVDYNIAILLLYCAARIELLTQKIRNVKNERELNMCIKLHNEILRYVNEVISVIRPIMFITIMTTAMAVIFGSLNLVTEQPIIVKIQYASIVLIAGTVLFACSLPADKLMHTSSKICLGAYESQWFEGSVSMQKKIIQIIFRAQKSEVISITGILPALTLRYYAGFLYSSLSYFTAVRIMISRD